MKLVRFFEKFDQFADAPNAVAKMRELVLELAIQGALVEHDSSDIPALVSLRQSKRAVLSLAVIDDGAAPLGWVSVPLGCVIASNTGGGTPSKQNPAYWNGSIPWASVKDIQANKYLTATIDAITEEGLKNSSSNLIPANRLLVVTRMGLGKLAINKIPVAINQDLRAIEPNEALDLDFAYLLLKALKLIGKGMTVKGVTVGELHSIPIALPPLAEQKRIVAKVDELMALCDRLDAQQQECDTRHAALARASLARFAEAPTPANLEFLFHKSYTITPADLRKSILTLAVQGKLVPQDPNDEPTEKVLAQLEARGGNAKTRRSVPTEVKRPDSLDVENLPELWVIESTARLLQLGAILDLKDGNHGANHPKVAEFTVTGLPFITAAQVSDEGRIDYDGAYKVSGEVLKRLRVGFAKPNDVIYTHKGSVGRVAICNRECVLTPQTTYYRVNEEVLSSGFVRIYLLSPLFRDQVDLVKRQTTRDFVSIKAQYQFFLRVPPLAEQYRIVAKVDQLMALVDQLENQLNASRAIAEKLMEAVVAELVKSEPSVVSAPVSDQKTAQSNLASIASRRSAKEKVSDEFVEAIVIAQLTRDLATSKFPLGRMRYNKLAYLAHRKAEDDVMQRYLKKAAGPYSPWAKYGGPERIALKNGYIKNAKSGNYEGWIPGERVGDIDLYLPSYPICSAVSWAVGKLRYKKKEELELLATVDFAALDLRTRDCDVTRETIKWIISTNKEWAPKLNRDIFSDESIDKALAELPSLFPSHYT